MEGDEEGVQEMWVNEVRVTKRIKFGLEFAPSVWYLRLRHVNN